MQPDLVYDVGMLYGEDTAHYLRRGYRVLGIEANPAMAAAVRERFAAEIADGRLSVLETAIAAAPGSADFWISAEPGLSSLFRDNATGGGNSAHCVQVPCTTFGEILGRFGTPFYLKVDIERADHLCLEAIDPADPPQYVSFEKTRLSDLLHMRSIGYSRFKLIEQQDMRQFIFPPPAGGFGRRLRRLPARLAERFVARPGRRPAGGSAHGGSGPFGEETDGRWQSMEEVALTWLAFDLGHVPGSDPVQHDWFDVHCAR